MRASLFDYTEDIICFRFLLGTAVDLRLVYGFAFDPDAGERAKEFPPEESAGWAVAAEERSIGRLP